MNIIRILIFALAAFTLIAGNSSAFAQSAQPGAQNSGGTTWAGARRYAIIDTQVPAYYPRKITNSGLFLIDTAYRNSAVWQNGATIEENSAWIADINENGDYINDNTLFINGVETAVWQNPPPNDDISGYVDEYLFGGAAGTFKALNNSDTVAGNVYLYDPTDSSDLFPLYYYSPDALFSGGSPTYTTPFSWWVDNDTTGYMGQNSPDGVYGPYAGGYCYAVNDNGIALSFRQIDWWDWSQSRDTDLGGWSVYLINNQIVTDGFIPEQLSNSGAVVGASGTTVIIRQSGSADIVLGSNGADAAIFEPARINNYQMTVTASNGQTSQIPAPQVVNGGWSYTPTLWSVNPATGKYEGENLNDLIDPKSGWKIDIAGAINDNGCIAATGYGPGTGEHALLLLPLDLTVDNKRNAFVAIDGGNENGSTVTNGFAAQPDLVVAPIPYGSDQMKVLKLLTGGLNLTGLTYRLSGTSVSQGGRIKVWTDYYKNQEIVLPCDFAPDQIPDILYVEGVNESAALRDTQLSLSAIFQGQESGSGTASVSVAPIVTNVTCAMGQVVQTPPHGLEILIETQADDYPGMQIAFDVETGGVMSGTSRMIQNVTEISGTTAYTASSGKAPVTLALSSDPPLLDSKSEPPPFSNAFFTDTVAGQLSQTAFETVAFDSPDFVYPDELITINNISGPSAFEQFLLWQFPDGTLRALYHQPWKVYWHCTVDSEPNGNGGTNFALVISNDSAVSAAAPVKSSDPPPKLIGPIANDVDFDWR